MESTGRAAALLVGGPSGPRGSPWTRPSDRDQLSTAGATFSDTATVTPGCVETSPIRTTTIAVPDARTPSGISTSSRVTPGEPESPGSPFMAAVCPPIVTVNGTPDDFRPNPVAYRLTVDPTAAGFFAALYDPS